MALAKIGPAAAEAVPALKKNIEDDDYVGANAAMALERINT